MSEPIQISDGAREAAENEIVSDQEKSFKGPRRNLTEQQPISETGHFVHAYAQSEVEKATREKDLTIESLRYRVQELETNYKIRGQEMMQKDVEIERLQSEHKQNLDACDEAYATACIKLADLQNKAEVEGFRETCSQCNQQWSPSLVESGRCIFCILKDRTKERDTLKAQLAELTEIADKMSKQYHNEMMAFFGHAADCDCSRCEPMHRYTTYLAKYKE